MIKLTSPSPSAKPRAAQRAYKRKRRHELPGSMRVIKYLIFFLSFVSLAIGVKLIVVGSILNVQFKGYVDFEGKTSIASAAIAIIAFGALVTLISFFGCTGSIRESRSMIIIVNILAIINEKFLYELRKMVTFFQLI
jgi:hypothetical protein